MEPKPPQILTVEQCARLMHAAHEERPRGLAVFALCLFAGVRPDEVARIGWDAVDLDRGEVRVDAAASKVRTRRIVHLRPAAVEWIRAAREAGAALPYPMGTRIALFRWARQLLGFRSWPQDVCRHTAASYWIAACPDAGMVAAELGNSPQILLTHYRELVGAEQASEFWELRPKKVADSSCAP